MPAAAWLSAAVVLVLMVAGSGATPFVVDTATQFIVEAKTGRSMLFHGVNAVYKVFPWIPDAHTFSTQYSLCEEDYANLRSWGFNAVRLGVMWPGVEWERGVYNQTYLDVVEEIVDGLAQHGIYTLLDAHYDLFSRRFCGEGAPDWAVYDETAFLPFPQPIADSIPVNASTGYPQLDACLKRGFFEYYFSHAVSAAYQGLYSNWNGTLDSYAGFWAAVAARFRDNDGVLGYELINEPWAGDIYADPSLLEFGVADRKNLAPMYEKLNGAIRAVDNNTLIFYQDAVSNQGRTGLEHGPGGPAYDNRSVYSYHIYCAPANKSGDPTHVAECNAVDEYFYLNKFADVGKLGGGGFLTEMGAMLESGTETATLDFLLDIADANLQSYAYWQFKSYHDITTASQPFDESFYNPDGSFQLAKIKTLSRTYAQATAGRPLAMHFDTATARFDFTFASDPSIAAPTTIYASSQLWYPSGHTVAVSPPGAATWTAPDANHLDFTTSASVAPGTHITITITAD